MKNYLKNIKNIYSIYKKNNFNNLKIGDIINIYYKTIENKKEIIKKINGIIIGIQNKNLGKTITIYSNYNNIKIKYIIPIYFLDIIKIKIKINIKNTKAKLYFSYNKKYI